MAMSAKEHIVEEWRRDIKIDEVTVNRFDRLDLSKSRRIGDK
jgi:hypothetical protein